MHKQQGFVSIGVLIAILVGLTVLGGGAYYFVLHQASSSNLSTSASTVLQCSGVSIPMPEKWTELTPAASSKLDANGCSKNDIGCLCIRKDPVDPTKNLVFAVLVTTYPTGFTLDSLVDSEGPVSDVENFNFLGYPAVRFTATGKNQTISTAFIKDQKLYKFDFGASDNNTFNGLWPDMEAALQGVQLQ